MCPSELHFSPFDKLSLLMSYEIVMMEPKLYQLVSALTRFRFKEELRFKNFYKEDWSTDIPKLRKAAIAKPEKIGIDFIFQNLTNIRYHKNLLKSNPNNFYWDLLMIKLKKWALNWKLWKNLKNWPFWQRIKLTQ